MSVNSKPNKLLSVFNKNDYIGIDELTSSPNLSDIHTLQENKTKIDDNFSHINNKLSKSVYSFTGSSSVLGTNALDYKAYTLNMTILLNNTSSDIMFKKGSYYSIGIDTTIIDVLDIRILQCRVEIFSNLVRIFRGNLFQYKVLGTTNSCTLCGIADIVVFENDYSSVTCNIEIIQFVRNASDKPILLNSRLNIIEIG
jgi:hypothetical protein